MLRIWVMSVLFIVNVTLCFHHIPHITLASHVTACGLRMTWSREFTKMWSCSHDSVPIAKKSVPIHIGTQARGFMEDKTVIFPGWHHHVMTFGKTIMSMSRDNGCPAHQRLVTWVNRCVAKGLRYFRCRESCFRKLRKCSNFSMCVIFGGCSCREL